MNDALGQGLAALAAGAPNLGRDSTAAVVEELMSGATPDGLDAAQQASRVGAWLMGLAIRGETMDEIAGAAAAMRAASVWVPTSRSPVLDTCGTGGSGIPRRNVSTAAALCVAACGGAVAKHGNRAASSRSGSADVLEALGVGIGAPPEVVGRCIDEIGVGFLFARNLHPAMKYAGPIRRALGVRTIFNLLGPMTNPAGAKRQVMGVYDPRRLEPIAQALGALGSERVFVVHGFFAGVLASESSAPGIDDLSPEGATLCFELRDGSVSRHVLTPKRAGLPRVALADLAGGDPHDNAMALRDLVDGKTDTPARAAYAQAVAYAAGLGLLALSDDPLDALPDHVARARAALSRGAVGAIVDSLIDATGASTA